MLGLKNESTLVFKLLFIKFAKTRPLFLGNLAFQFHPEESVAVGIRSALPSFRVFANISDSLQESRHSNEPIPMRT